jgi:2-dehydro-3-deoxygalactonokinase
MNNFIISCDWGTSEFRLRLINLKEESVINEITSPNGVLNIHNSWTADSKKNSKKECYLQFLLPQVEILLAEQLKEKKNIPILVSGMASSSIGIEELPYAKIPFALNGKNTISKFMKSNAEFPYDLLLISGVSTSNDVMRGEETQLVGIAQIKELMQLNEEAICIFPGTHSKHIKISKGNVVDFKTYLTGEMFELLSTKSVLKGAVSKEDNQKVIDKLNLQSFYKGINASQNKANLLNQLFSVRTNALFSLLSAQENYFYLSGLLIGYEIRSLHQEMPCTIVLCSGNSLSQLYQLAIEKLSFEAKTIYIEPAMMDKAAYWGQIKIFQSFQQRK